ncbi:tryptophan synthase subunit alpha [Echinimonas agarilytica]|uniref:Tryptophan synthase alpha chain n=1 Tax=Echinimonas agarilytica TaxID=1215918 RepID=A0AA41W6A6_9GAMM|nr:tryptophan synthase subunit alpha [Echinimonas agarilytica]MCM2679487.1 tryptophan synthase subunit alpha [Echinimonas agarilytica]
MSNRYEDMFKRLNAKNQGAFVPFVTIGDPNPELSLDIIRTLVTSGADAIELGIPFSDPLADGPTIQGATIRALDSGTTPKVCFDIIEKIRAEFPELPIGLLMYANLVFARGIDSFYQQCAQAGVDSVLVADVPIEMSAPFADAAKANNVDAIFIAPPNADDAAMAELARLGSGYTYLLSRAGVTGAETEAGMPITALLDRLKQYDAPPPLLGFGISRPEQVKEAIESGAAGAIAGSSVVKVIEHNVDDGKALLENMAQYISSMKAATQLS